jgi:hypothetical protein
MKHFCLLPSAFYLCFCPFLFSQPQSHCPQLHLLPRFFGADVEGAVLLGQAVGDLEQQGGFANARIAANQHQGTGDNAAAQNPIEFQIARGEARLGMLRDLSQGEGGPGGGWGTTRGFAAVVAGSGCTSANCDRRGGGNYLFLQGIPAMAGGAFAKVLGRFSSALVADVVRSSFWHCNEIN